MAYTIIVEDLFEDLFWLIPTVDEGICFVDVGFVEVGSVEVGFVDVGFADVEVSSTNSKGYSWTYFSSRSTPAGRMW